MKDIHEWLDQAQAPSATEIEARADLSFAVAALRAVLTLTEDKSWDVAEECPTGEWIHDRVVAVSDVKDAIATVFGDGE